MREIPSDGTLNVEAEARQARHPPAQSAPPGLSEKGLLLESGFMGLRIVQGWMWVYAVFSGQQERFIPAETSKKRYRYK